MTVSKSDPIYSAFANSHNILSILVVRSTLLSSTEKYLLNIMLKSSMYLKSDPIYPAFANSHNILSILVVVL